MISVISEPSFLYLLYDLTRPKATPLFHNNATFVFLCFSCRQFRILSRLDTLSMSSPTLTPMPFVTSHPSNSYRDSSGSPKIPSSRNTRSILLAHTDRPPTSLDDLITERSRSATRARPVDIRL